MVTKGVSLLSANTVVSLISRRGYWKEDISYEIKKSYQTYGSCAKCVCVGRGVCGGGVWVGGLCLFGFFFPVHTDVKGFWGLQ